MPYVCGTAISAWRAALAAFFVLAAARAEALEFAWAKTFGGPLAQSGWSIAIDAAGNVYVLGSFEGTVDFDPDPAGVYNLTSAGGSADDVFLCKLDPAGHLVWAKQMGGVGDELGYAIVLDEDGNVYATGDMYGGPADFDPDPAVTYNLSGYGAFVIKLDSNGNLIWARAVTVPATSIGAHGTSLTLGADGSVFVAGYFQGTIDLDPDPAATHTATSAGYDVFVVKLDPSGAFAWGAPFGGPGYDATGGVAVDAAGDVYVTGGFQQTVDFDPGPGVTTLTSAGASDAFLAKFDTHGALLWARQLGGTEGDGVGLIALDGTGNLIVGGRSWGSVDADPDPAGTLILPGPGSFFAKIDPNADLIWAGLIGNGLECYSLTLDDAANVYVTGEFYGSPDFDPDAGAAYTLPNAGFNDAFLLKLDAAGHFVWAKSIAGSMYETGWSVAVDATGNVYSTGYYRGTTDFDPGSATYTLSSIGTYGDAFVVKLTQTPGVRFTSKSTLAWERLFGEAHYDVYRSDGVLPGTFTCLVSHGTQPVVTDPENPAANALFAYLVTAVSAWGAEGSMGYQAVNGSATTERPNSNPCP